MGEIFIENESHGNFQCCSMSHWNCMGSTGTPCGKGSQIRALYQKKLFRYSKWLCRHVFIIQLIHNNICIGIGRRAENTQFLIDCTRKHRKTHTAIFPSYLCAVLSFSHPKYLRQIHLNWAYDNKYTLYIERKKKYLCSERSLCVPKNISDQFRWQQALEILWIVRQTKWNRNVFTNTRNTEQGEYTFDAMQNMYTYVDWKPLRIRRHGFRCCVVVRTERSTRTTAQFCVQM